MLPILSALAALSQTMPARSKLGAHVRLAALTLTKEASVEDVVRAVATPPLALIGAIGHGLSGAGHAGSQLAAQLPEHGLATRTLAALPAAIGGGAKAFSEAGGPRAAALTALGGLAAVGGKSLYDRYQAEHPTPPAGYYAPGGY